MNRVLTASLLLFALAGCQTLGGGSSSSSAGTGSSQSAAVTPTADTAGAVSAHLMTCLDKVRGAWPKDQQVVKLRLRLTTDNDGKVVAWESADPLRYENDLVYKAAADAGGAAVLHPACGKLTLPSSERAAWRQFIFAFAPYEARRA